jgi:hypothetical protein
MSDAVYAVPHELIGERVWVRVEGEQLVVVHIEPDQRPREVARHRPTTRGRPSIQDPHYRPGRPGRWSATRARNSEQRDGPHRR